LILPPAAPSERLHGGKQLQNQSMKRQKQDVFDSQNCYEDLQVAYNKLHAVRFEVLDYEPTEYWKTELLRKVEDIEQQLKELKRNLQT
jgi:hypothetical protein